MDLPFADARAALLAWYRDHRRDLPWRHSRDPYRVWISEVMLQQTRVDTVIPYWRTFTERWPDVKALATADPDAVRSAWSGLGYYSRATRMMEAAQAICADHGGELPPTYDALRRLPGFGPYTAGAVASIAFDAPVPAVDGNVSRVLARVLALPGLSAADKRQIDATAARLADGDAPGELNQALIELGALICKPKRPTCEACPLHGACRARARGLTEALPARRVRPARPKVGLTAAVVRRGGEVLLERRPPEGILAALWCPPLFDGVLDGATVEAACAARFGLDAGPAEAGQPVRHILTHRELSVRTFALESTERADGGDAWRFVPLGALSALGLPSLAVKLLVAGLPEAELDGVALPGRRTRRRAAR